MREWYIVDRRDGHIVNCSMTSKPEGPDLSLDINSEHLYATTTPTQQQLQSYRYYWERP